MKFRRKLNEWKWVKLFEEMIALSTVKLNVVLRLLMQVGIPLWSSFVIPHDKRLEFDL